MNHSPTAPLASADYRYEREHDGPALKEHVSEEELRCRRKSIYPVGRGDDKTLRYLVRCAERGLVPKHAADDLELLVSCQIDAAGRDMLSPEDCLIAIPREIASSVRAFEMPGTPTIDGDKSYFELKLYKSTCLC